MWLNNLALNDSQLTVFLNDDYKIKNWIGVSLRSFTPLEHPEGHKGVLKRVPCKGFYTLFLRVLAARSLWREILKKISPAQRGRSRWQFGNNRSRWQFGNSRSRWQIRCRSRWQGRWHSRWHDKTSPTRQQFVMPGKAFFMEWRFNEVALDSGPIRYVVEDILFNQRLDFSFFWIDLAGRNDCNCLFRIKPAEFFAVDTIHCKDTPVELMRMFFFLDCSDDL